MMTDPGHLPGLGSHFGRRIGGRQRRAGRAEQERSDKGSAYRIPGMGSPISEPGLISATTPLGTTVCFPLASANEIARAPDPENGRTSTMSRESPPELPTLTSESTQPIKSRDPPWSAGHLARPLLSHSLSLLASARSRTDNSSPRGIRHPGSGTTRPPQMGGFGGPCREGETP